MQRFRRLRSTNVQKAVAAVSGGFMAGWLVLHVLGNLTAFAGQGRMDAYAAALRHFGPGLWLVRVALLVAIGGHVAATLTLARRARAARPVRDVRRWPRGSVTSRTAIIGGPLLLVFAAYHLLHMTFGVVHPSFSPDHVYANLVSGLAPPAIAALYVLGAGLVGLHLHRGLSSAFASLGAKNATNAVPRTLSAAIAVAIAVGFATIPVAVLARVVR
jgi:succinate dehydrogenase / fumarate reductase cytochrome b subunit